MKPALSVAHLAPYSITLPLSEHQARYDWMLDLATRQAAAGLNVSIYSNPDSFVAIPGINWRSPPKTDMDKAAANRAIFSTAFTDSDIDIYHSHFDNLHYSLASITSRPVVFTQHWWPTAETVTAARQSDADNVWAVPPTKYMRAFDQTQGIRAENHIYHGIDLQLFRQTGDITSERLLCVGRISPEKNLQTAISVARKAGMGLDIIGKLTPKNKPYWDQLANQVDGTQIRYLGTASQSELVNYYNRAAAVIFPADGHEAFGLVAIEAQACGTPVLMIAGGSRPELIAQGKTGYLCGSVDEFADAARKASQLSPAECSTFAANFDVNRMVDIYSDLYHRLIRHSS